MRAKLFALIFTVLPLLLYGQEIKPKIEFKFTNGAKLSEETKEIGLICREQRGEGKETGTEELTIIFPWVVEEAKIEITIDKLSNEDPDPVSAGIWQFFEHSNEPRREIIAKNVKEVSVKFRSQKTGSAALGVEARGTWTNGINYIGRWDLRPCHSFKLSYKFSDSMQKDGKAWPVTALPSRESLSAKIEPLDKQRSVEHSFVWLRYIKVEEVDNPEVVKILEALEITSVNIDVKKHGLFHLLEILWVGRKGGEATIIKRDGLSNIQGLRPKDDTVKMWKEDRKRVLPPKDEDKSYGYENQKASIKFGVEGYFHFYVSVSAEAAQGSDAAAAAFYTCESELEVKCPYERLDP